MPLISAPDCVFASYLEWMAAFSLLLLTSFFRCSTSEASLTFSAASLTFSASRSALSDMQPQLISLLREFAISAWLQTTCRAGCHCRTLPLDLRLFCSPSHTALPPSSVGQHHVCAQSWQITYRLTTCQKLPYWNGDRFSKPSFWVSILILQGVESEKIRF